MMEAIGEYRWKHFSAPIKGVSFLDFLAKQYADEIAKSELLKTSKNAQNYGEIINYMTISLTNATQYSQIMNNSNCYRKNNKN
jgi:hypothetical protein